MTTSYRVSGPVLPAGTVKFYLDGAKADVERMAALLAVVLPMTGAQVTGCTGAYGGRGTTRHLRMTVRAEVREEWRWSA